MSSTTRAICASVANRTIADFSAFPAIVNGADSTVTRCTATSWSIANYCGFSAIPLGILQYVRLNRAVESVTATSDIPEIVE